MRTGQLPPNKKTGADWTTLKQLHTLYKKGDLKQSTKDDLILVKTKSGAGVFEDGYAISIPSPLMPGLLTAVHLRSGHAGPTQMERLIERYFFAPGWRQMLKKLYQPGGCLLCYSLKTLPPVLAMETNSVSSGVAVNFWRCCRRRGGGSTRRRRRGRGRGRSRWRRR